MTKIITLCNRCVYEPNQQRTLNKVPTELRCRNVVIKHRLSMQIGAQRVLKTCMQPVHIPTELPSCIPPLVVGKGTSPTGFPGLTASSHHHLSGFQGHLESMLDDGGIGGSDDIPKPISTQKDSDEFHSDTLLLRGHTRIDDGGIVKQISLPDGTFKLTSLKATRLNVLSVTNL